MADAADQAASLSLVAKADAVDKEGPACPVHCQAAGAATVVEEDRVVLGAVVWEVPR